MGVTEAEIIARELQEIGVPREDVILENKSKNTFQNAQFSAAIIQEQKPDYAVLVTSGFHMKRALKYFDYFLAKIPLL
jgi:uncharacterized SAM-binding protein YcdF (DUF218 family)